jgi:predicted enzyme related to lactoylglutathione lyase
MALRDQAVVTILPANDIGRAKQFYAEQLGFSPIAEDPARVRYALADGSGFYLSPTSNTNRGGNTQMAFAVSDIESEVAELRARGVVFVEYDSGPFKTTDGIAEYEGERVAWFNDSEDNWIGLFQHLG